MNTNPIINKVASLIALTACVVGLAISPVINVDPINVPKLTLLFILTMAAVGVALSSPFLFFAQQNKVFFIAVSLFITQMVLVMIFSNAPLNQQLFGTFGRNTGFIAYLSLGFLSLVSLFAGSIFFSEKLIYAILITGGLTTIYGILQTTGNDPIKWANPYNNLIGFLGNPNFSSSFLGISATGAVAILMRRKISLLVRVSVLLFVIGALALIIRSNSQQGALVFAAGTFVVLSLFLIGTQFRMKKVFLGSFFTLGIIFGSAVVAGTLNQGPLGDLLYKLSVRQRGFYWNAAIEMMQSKPLFGVGLDSFGDWYFQLRSSNAALLSPDAQSNAAHNIFLDMGATGGFPLFFLYLFIMMFTLFISIKYLYRNPTFNWGFAGLFGCWIAYQAQAVISINQLGLGVWGWTMTGALIGIEYKSRKNESPVDNKSSTLSQSKRNSGKKSKEKISIQNVGFGAVAGIIALLAILPFYTSDTSYRKSLDTRSAEQLVLAATKSPIDTNRTLQAANILINSKLPVPAKELINKVLSENPRYYSAWKLLYEISEESSPDKLRAANKLRELNPKVPIA
jgi:O-antigen ligase